jgi:hypothetical protein
MRHKIRLTHSVIVKAPALLPMLYTVKELSGAVGVHERTLRDWLHLGDLYVRNDEGIWINGKAFAAWVVRMQKPKRERKLKDQEGYCMRCDQIVEMQNPSITHEKGKLIRIRGKCPICRCTINRGGRIPSCTTQISKGKEN